MAKKKKTTAVAKREKAAEPIAVEATKVTETEEIIALGVGEIGIKPFKNPENMSAMELIEFIREKNTARIQDEFELSCALWVAQDKKIHVNQGYEWNDFCRDQCGLSPTKANALLTLWANLVALGVANVKKMIGYSWYKIKLLGPAIKHGKIGKRNIDSWIEKCKVDGEKGMKSEDLEAVIKGLIKESKGEKSDTGLVPVKYMIPNFDLETINQFESIAKAELKTEVRGTFLVQAAVEYSTNHASAQDAQAWRARGLASVKELAERMAPVVALFMPTDPNQNTQEALGVFPFTTVYQGFPNEDGERALRYCVASSEAEAKAFLKVKEVRAFKVEIAPSLKPKIGFQASVIETPKEEPTAEAPTKGKGKGKGKGKKAEEAPKEEGSKAKEKKAKVPELTANQKKALAMPDEEVKALVMSLIKRLKIAKETYAKKKTEIQAELPPGLTSTQAMAAWLLDQDK